MNSSLAKFRRFPKTLSRCSRQNSEKSSGLITVRVTSPISSQPGSCIGAQGIERLTPLPPLKFVLDSCDRIGEPLRRLFHKVCIRANDRRRRFMSTITTKDGTQIYYKDWGKGPVVTFSHGWPLNAGAWDGQLLFFAQNGFRAVAHDRRGHGRSSQPSSGNTMDGS